MPDEVVTDAPTSLRTLAAELRYQQAKKTGDTKPLELVDSIKQWDHWRLIKNDFPYDAAFRVHHMLLPKRAAVTSRFELNDAERKELDHIVKTLVHPEYDMLFENSPHRQSVRSIYHLHLVIYKDNREEGR